ncbi:MAG: class I SAM-dependent methyltransferase [bacterium]
MKDLSQKIEKEVEYWNKRADSGIIPDIRRQTKDKEVYFIWDDPKIEEILRGQERKFIIEQTSKNKRGKVLEIGCGVGWLSLELARHGMNVTGVDLSDRKISIAKEYYERIKVEEGFTGKIEYIADSIHNVDFEDSTFDAVVAWDSLHHIPDISRVMRKLRCWLKENGELIICDYMGNNPFNRLAVVMIYVLPIIDKGKLFKKIMKKIAKEEDFKKAPLEGITGWEILREIRMNFEVHEAKTTIAFCYYVAPFLFFQGDTMYRWTEFFKRLDDAMVRLHFLRGEYIFVWATNKKRRDYV